MSNDGTIVAVDVGARSASGGETDRLRRARVRKLVLDAERCNFRCACSCWSMAAAHMPILFCDSRPFEGPRHDHASTCAHCKQAARGVHMCTLSRRRDGTCVRIQGQKAGLCDIWTYNLHDITVVSPLYLIRLCATGSNVRLPVRACYPRRVPLPRCSALALASVQVVA